MTKYRMLEEGENPTQEPITGEGEGCLVLIVISGIALVLLAAGALFVYRMGVPAWIPF